MKKNKALDIGKRRKHLSFKHKVLTAAFLGMFFLGGCESAELEQRSFPLAVGIDLQETVEGNEREARERNLVVSFDFPDLAQISEKGKTTDTPMAMSLEGMDMYHIDKSYENNTNRILDYNHIKAVVLGKNLISDARRLRSLLLAWEQQEAAARNISLFVGGSSAAEILTLTQETEGSMGTYLEEMLESQKDFRQKKIATIGSLINQWHNQDELLLIPVLTERGSRPAITGYAAVENFDYCGILTVEEAMETFLCQNLLESFLCEPEWDEAAEISNIQTVLSVDEAEGTPVVTVSIKGQGRMKTGQINSVGQQYQVAQRMEKHITANLQETAARLREEYGVDITNSYVSLGGLTRGLYWKYQNRPQEYNKRVEHVFEVDIEILDW